jgi:SAM-dependent methyltransferase
VERPTPLDDTFAGPPRPAWYETDLGAYLVRRERAFFDAEVADLFGFHAIQLGLPECHFLEANRMPCRVIAGLDGDVGVALDFCELPFATGSVDLVVLPHTLESSANPHQVLREVQRVLMPEGHVVISGFNPWSLWGAARLWRRGHGEFPWDNQFIGLSRLKDWLALLGFESQAGRMAAYAPPCRNQKWLHRWRFMEFAGDRWWPFAGGLYFLHGIKRVKGTRLITPRWRMAATRKKALAAVPNRVAECRPSRVLRDATDPSGDG